MSSSAVSSGCLAFRAKGFRTLRSPEREFYRDGYKDRRPVTVIEKLHVSVTIPGKKGRAPRDSKSLTALEKSWQWTALLCLPPGTILPNLGEEQAGFIRGRSKTSHQRGRRLMSQLVAAGEFDMAVETNLNSVLSLSRQGAPLWFAPAPPFFLTPSLVFVNASAPHPFAGALFTDYLLSEEGQKIIVTTNRMPAHAKVSPSKLLKARLAMQDISIWETLSSDRNRYGSLHGAR